MAWHHLQAAPRLVRVAALAVTLLASATVLASAAADAAADGIVGRSHDGRPIFGSFQVRRRF